MRDTRYEIGSALILTVVLTSLLAIVAVMFVMAARVDRIATSSITENKELNFAVETVIAGISNELALDVPGLSAVNRDYYDYPGPEDKWLASLEPYKDGTDHKWRQISDVTRFLADNGFSTQDVNVEPVGLTTLKYVREYPEIKVNSDGKFLDRYGNLATDGVSADADGDGVADSKWVKLEDITSSKGKPIFAAIRITDNGGMVNVNTAYKFDPNAPGVEATEIDGSRLAQIHMLDFAKKNSSDDANDLHRLRCDDDEPDLLEFNDECAIRIENPDRSTINYLPYDIGDELELRNRFVLDMQYNVARVETALTRTLTYPAGKVYRNRFAPIDSSDDFSDWQEMMDPEYLYPLQEYYNFRKLLTTFNIDRIIDPNGGKMINVNKITSVQRLYDMLVRSIDPDIKNDDRKEIKKRFAQLAVNLIDFADPNTEVTVFEPNDPNIGTDTYYGFEAQPFITEIAMKIATAPEIGRSYFAVELYNPFDKEINLEDFALVLADSDNPGPGDPNISFNAGDIIGPKSCFVIANEPDEFDITGGDTKEDEKLKFFSGWEEAYEGRPPIDRRGDPDESKSPVYIGWAESYDLYLKRKVDVDGTKEWIYVDKQRIDPNWAPADAQRSYGRDVRLSPLVDWHIAYQTLERDASSRGTLGIRNNIDPDQFSDRGHDFSFFLPNAYDSTPERKIVTVGDIPRILTIGPDTERSNTIGEQLRRTSKVNEDQVRLDLQNPYHRNVFQYLTVFDPSTDRDSLDNPIDNDGDGVANETNLNQTPEFKIPGRININTAPWYVVAQLPWVSDELAQAIVAYRDKLKLEKIPDPDVDYSGGRYDVLRNISGTSFDFDDPCDVREEPGFASIGELNFCLDGDDDEYSTAKYALDNTDLDDFPDLTTDRPGGGDRIEDDFEERDIIFSRISNLVTVRSDVFTAYILVRIGTDGPQKRVIAILDRSDVYPPNGKVKIVALHSTPDPR